MCCRGPKSLPAQGALCASRAPISLLGPCELAGDRAATGGPCRLMGVLEAHRAPYLVSLWRPHDPQY